MGSLRDSQFWLEKGNEHLSLGRYVDALAAYESAIELDQNSAFSWHGKGNVHLSLGRYAEALAAYERTIELDQSFASAWGNMGGALEGLDRLDDALSAYERAIELDRNFAAAWSNKGNTLWKFRRFDDALAAYERAIALSPKFAAAWNGKGNALCGLRRFADALPAYERAIDLDKNFAVAWNCKGAALFDCQRFSDAVDAYRRAIEINPEYADAWANKGIACHCLGRFELALEAYANAISLNKEKAKAHPWSGKGDTLLALSRHDQALDAYAHAIFLDSSFAPAWHGKGFVYQKLDRFEDACRAFRRGLQFASSEDILRVASGLLWAFGGGASEAPFLLFRLVREDPDLWVKDGWLETLSRMGRDHAAALACQAALESMPPTDVPLERQIWLRAGGCLSFHMGDPMVAESNFFDAMTDEFSDDLLGHYYLFMSREAYLADNSAVLVGAIEAARRYSGDDPEQNYYAGLILSLTEEKQESLLALERAGAYTPALALRFNAAQDAGDSVTAKDLADQILDLELTAAPTRRFLNFSEELQVGLCSVGWIGDVLHWTKRSELKVEFISFLEALRSPTYHDLRLKYGEVLQDTHVGPMDLIVALRLDKKSKLMMAELAAGARRADVEAMRCQAEELAIRLDDYDNLDGEKLEAKLENLFRGDRVKLKEECLIVAYCYAKKSLSLPAAFSLLLYRQYWHSKSDKNTPKEYLLTTLLTIAGQAGSDIPKFMGFSGAWWSPLLLYLGPVSMAWLASRDLINSNTADYATFKTELMTVARNKGWDMPEGFWSI